MSTLRDSRQVNWFWIDNAVLDSCQLTPYEFTVYSIIARHADNKSGKAFPGLATFMRKGNMSKTKVIRAIKRLEELGLICVERDTKPTTGETRQRAANRYTLQTVAGVVSDKHYPSTPQTLGVVSDMDNNKTHVELDSDNLAANAAQGKTSKPRKPRAPKPDKKSGWNKLVEAVTKHLFQDATEGSAYKRIGMACSELRAISPGITDEQLASDVQTFAAWWVAHYPDTSAPRDPSKLSEHWQAWRNNRNGMSSFEAALRGMKIEEYKP